MYQWWVFVHLVGVFGFLMAHGVSMGVAVRLRTERDPRRIGSLLEWSAWSLGPFYVSLGVLLLGGVVAGFLGHWWGKPWIWAAIVALVLISAAMSVLARPYYRRVGLVARAMANGSTAVGEEQLDSVLRSPRPLAVMGIGFAGLAFILYLMMFKPTFGFRSAAPVQADVRVSAKNVRFDTTTLVGPAGRPFTILFQNQESVPHNVAIYTDSSKRTLLFKGSDVSGPRSLVYHVPALRQGSYFFVCTIHPTQMTGTFVAR